MQEQANKRPRICEVLGVEVGEVFTADTPYGRFQRCVIDEEGQILNTGTNVLCYILNHPDRILRKPRFSEEEMAVLRHMASAGVSSVERLGNKRLAWYAVDRCGTMAVPPGFLPSLSPGHSAKLEDTNAK